MTQVQGEKLWEIVRYSSFFAHHGDCVGADAEFDAIVRLAPNCYGVIIHPCTITSKRAFVMPNYPRDVVRDPKDPLLRNDDIVAESDCMIATPKTMSAVMRSGTWATIRRAQAAKKPTCIIWPNGAMIYEGPAWPA